MISHNLNSPDEALDKNYSTFSMHRSAVGYIEATVSDADLLWHAGHDRTGNDAGAVALDRAGR